MAFTAAVHDQWHTDVVAARAHQAEDLIVVIDDDLPANRSLMVLELADGGGTVTTTAARASELGLTPGASVPRDTVHAAVATADIGMNDPDALFYLPAALQAEPVRLPSAPDTRRLTGADADAFGELTSAAPSDDVDEAFVELDHWLVYGTFVDGRLACAASMYPWRGTRLADLGVITLPPFRSRGLATRTVRAMSAEAIDRGYEPQYRCQLDNHASIALAVAAGFRRFATWFVIDLDD